MTAGQQHLLESNILGERHVKRKLRARSGALKGLGGATFRTVRGGESTGQSF